jgi:tRNA G37 N-methylase Trm5
MVVVDIGASIGDFLLTASRFEDARVYAFDPDPITFQYLKLNIAANGRGRVLAFNRAANEKSLEEIFQTYGESKVDLLKIDCEGYEYSLLSNCSRHTLSKVRRISMEIHPVKGHSKEELEEILQEAGFTTSYVKEFGQGPYIYAWRE